jgi:spermidine synthase
VRAGFGVRALPVQIGFTAAIAQIVLLRELMVVFHGNEISVGLVLACWLAWTAAGAALGGRLRWPRVRIVICETILAAGLPGSVLAVRAARPALHTIPGESLGPLAMLLVSLAVLIPVCVPLGALFSAGSRWWSERTSLGAGEAGGAVYLLEALGSAAGGVLAGLVLVERAGPLQIAWALGGVALLGGMVASERAWKLVLAAALCLWAGLALALPRLDAASVARSWSGFKLLAVRNSAYGNLAVVDNGGSRSLYENGLVLFTAPDPAAAEEAVHYALLAHPAPRHALLIGGGINGSLAQTLQHPSVQDIDYVELDPAVLELARLYFPEFWKPVVADPRVRVHVTDGRWFLKSGSFRYDVIIVNLPDPQTAQLNRFYTLEFFAQAARRLTDSGVLAFQLGGSEDYLSPGLADFLRSIHKTLRAVFPEVVLIPGDPIHFLAARRKGVLPADAEGFLARLRERHLHTLYVRDYYLPFRMMPDRVADLEAQIRPEPRTLVNRDFAPVAYYFSLAFWSGRFGSGYGEAFRDLARVDFRTVAAVLAVFLGLAAFTLGKLKHAPPRAAFATAAMGFTMIGLEILLLLAFQAIYGSLYQQLAILIGAFMAGMAAGSWLALRRGGRGSLTTPQILGAAAPLLLTGICGAVARWAGSAGSQWLFPLLAVLCGALGGYQFRVASRIFFAAGKSGNPGAPYALDLAGSCAGAILFSVYLIPVFGFARTAGLMAVVSLAPLAMPHRSRSPRNPL